MILKEHFFKPSVVLNKTKKNYLPLNLESCIDDKTQSIVFPLLSVHLLDKWTFHWKWSVKQIPRECLYSWETLKLNTFEKKSSF